MVASVIAICSIGDKDYGHGPYNATFNAGDTHALFNVSILDDDMEESSESFGLTIDPLSLPTDVTIDDPSKAKVTIMDNDGQFTVN